MPLRRGVFAEQELPVPAPGFERRRLAVRTSFWIGPSLTLDGRAAKHREGVYHVENDSGNEVLVRLHGRILDPIPSVDVDGQRITLVPPMKWHEYLVVCLPFSLTLIGGAVGAMVGAAGAYMNAKIVRTRRSLLLRYGLGLLVLLIVALAYIDLSTRAGWVMDMFRPIAERVGDRKDYAGTRQENAPPGDVHMPSLAALILTDHTWRVSEVRLDGVRQRSNLLIDATRTFREDGTLSQIYRDGSESRGKWHLAADDSRIVLTAGRSEYKADIIELTRKRLRMRAGKYEIIHIAE